MTFDSITNRAEFFSDHYLDARLSSDLKDLRKLWTEAEGRDRHTARMGLRGCKREFFNARAAAVEASPARRQDAVRELNDVVLAALGFDASRSELSLARNDDTDEVVALVGASVETPTGLLLVALDVELASNVDELFDTANDEDGAGQLLAPLTLENGNVAVASAADAPGALFSLDDPPRFVLLCAGTTLLLAERAKWAEGRFLAVDLDAALERSDTAANGELETICALFSADALVPGHLAEDETAAAFFDEIEESSTKHAVGVSKELREGMRRSVEILANEVIEQRLNRRLGVYEGENRVDPTLLTRQCLRWLYRVIVLLYAESRPELGILPVNDDAYLAGYSLDRLRELVLVDLEDDHARTGTHFDTSLRLLFELVNSGYHAEGAEQALLFDLDQLGDERTRTAEDYLQLPGLDATIFDPESTDLLDSVPLRNEALQRVLAHLMLNRDSGRASDQRGFISYAQLGINQLGAVYEGLMAYTGFFAKEDLFEVAKHGDPSDGTWMVPVDQADEYPDDVFVIGEDPLTGREERIRHPRGSFVYRLAGRDRQRSASYYTPEVLTSCVVRHALAELLGTDDYAREPGGSAGITEARQILDLTICEPALGSGAFLNEAINQLSAVYLKRRQAELGETLDADRYQRELQKVKAHFALHQSYGVDLNATAVELAEVSLWLNCMYPGLKAPWFGLQLRRGNSLIGCRRATWRVDQLKDKVWAKAKASNAIPPVDRPLAEALDDDEIHHFLLPGHGWGAAGRRKEAKELAADDASALREWQKAILNAPSVRDRERLLALAGGAERLWVEATGVLEALSTRMRRSLGLYGVDDGERAPSDDRRTAEAILSNPDSALGRLRLVMDAWVGLWFWPLTDDVSPPTWNQWLVVVEAVVGPEPAEPIGQLDLFDDLAAIEDLERRRAQGRTPTSEILEVNPWLAKANALAQQEGAWHWELEMAVAYRQGGFDLQVGNPPWVRPIWQDDITLAEWDPWWGVVDKVPEQERNQRRLNDLATADVQSSYLREVASHEGLNESVGSVQLWPVLAGLQTNLYMVFMDSVWRHMTNRGAAGMLHPESHYVDPKAASLREGSYERLRRHWQFFNGLLLFDEVHDQAAFGVNVYGPPGPVAFMQMGVLQHPRTVDESLIHDGVGAPPTPQHPSGGWNLRPHRDRLSTITPVVLSEWADLFDEPGVPPTQARLLRPVGLQDLEALSVLADQTNRLADHQYHWTSGWHEKGAKTDGTIRWETSVPTVWSDVILQGPHFSVATPLSQEPNDPCRHRQDYSRLSLEDLPECFVPRTNYHRACDREAYVAGLNHWNGTPHTEYARVAYREMTHPSLERSLHPALIPPGPANVGTVVVVALGTDEETAAWAGLLASLPYDYFVKVSGSGHVKDYIARRMPWPFPHALQPSLVHRALRLNCLTSDYSPLWEELYDPAWVSDRWTDLDLHRVVLGGIEPTWTLATPLRRDLERRLGSPPNKSLRSGRVRAGQGSSGLASRFCGALALVELDALAAVMLELTAEQLCAMYRTQFAVLRKYRGPRWRSTPRAGRSASTTSRLASAKPSSNRKPRTGRGLRTGRASGRCSSSGKRTLTLSIGRTSSSRRSLVRIVKRR